MKNKQLTTFILLSAILNWQISHAQGGIVTYLQIRDKSEHIAKLYIWQNKSSYVFDKIGQNPPSKSNFNIKRDLDVDDYPDEFGYITFVDFTKKQLFEREKYGKRAFIYEENLPVIKWKVLNENKLIGKFNCQKATTTFRGRNYEAWFTTEIPISMGPWKLNGLPGLILEAYDNTLQIQFMFNSLSMSENVQNNLIFPIKEGKKITFEEHKTLDDIIFKSTLTMADLPKGVSVTFEPNKRRYFELSYEK